MSDMPTFTEILIGKIATDILLKRMKELQEEPVFETVHIAAFEKYTKLYLALREDMRKNMDEDLARFEAIRKKSAAQQR